LAPFFASALLKALDQTRIKPKDSRFDPLCLGG
jgi:hypothetical protein